MLLMTDVDFSYKNENIKEFTRREIIINMYHNNIDLNYHFNEKKQ